MKVQLLPSSFEPDGTASPRQHTTCFVIDGAVAIDAGSLAMAATETHRANVRDVVLTHAHLDHIAGLPLFIDDLFSDLAEPVVVHAAQSVIDSLEDNVFNWSIYPRFSELKNANGSVLQYKPFEPEAEFGVRHLRFRAIGVNHRVPSYGFLVSDGQSTIALSGDTAEMDDFWDVVNRSNGVAALLIECAFPNDLGDLAKISHHLTPARLAAELSKCELSKCPVYVVNLKPTYRETIVHELADLGIPGLQVLEIGKVYDWGSSESQTT